VAGRSIGRVYVTVLADSSRFAKEVRDNAKNAGGLASRDFQDEFKKELGSIRLNKELDRLAGDWAKQWNKAIRGYDKDLFSDTDRLRATKDFEDMVGELADTLGKQLDLSSADVRDMLLQRLGGALEDVERENERAAKQYESDWSAAIKEHQRREADLRKQQEKYAASRAREMSDWRGMLIRAYDQNEKFNKQREKEERAHIALIIRATRENDEFNNGLRDGNGLLIRRTRQLNINDSINSKIAKSLRRAGTGGAFDAITNLLAIPFALGTKVDDLIGGLAKGTAKLGESAVEAGTNLQAFGGILGTLGKGLSGVGGKLGSFGAVLGKVAGGAAFVTLPITFALISVLIGGLVSGLSALAGGFVILGSAVYYAAGSLAVIAPGIAAFAAAAAVTFIAVKDVVGVLGKMSEALNETDPKKRAKDFEEYRQALENLSPAARNFVIALEPLVKSFSKIQDTVESNFFAGLAGQVGGLAPGIKILGDGLAKVSSALNDAIGYFFRLTGQSQNLERWTELWDGLADVTESMARATADFLVGLSGLFAGLLPATKRVGNNIEDIFQRFREWTNSTAGQNSIKSFMDDAYDAGAAVFRIFGALGRAFASLFGGAKDEGQGFLKTLEDSANSFADFVEGAVEDGSLDEWLQDAKDAFNEFMDVLAAVKGAFASLNTEEARNSLTSILNTIEFLVNAFDAVYDFFGAISGAIGATVNAISVAWGALVTGVGTAFTWLQETANTVWTAITGAVSNAWIAIQGALAPLVEFFQVVIPAVLGAFLGFWTTVWNIAAIPLRIAIGLIILAFQEITGALNTLWTTVTGWIATAWNTLTGLLSGPVRAATSAVQGVLRGIGGFFTDVWNTVTGWISSTWSAITELLSQPIQDAVDTIGRIWSGLGDVLGNLAGGVGDAFRGTLNWIIDRINTLIGGINRVIDGANRLPGPDIIGNIGEIPRLARGTITSGPTLAMIGEAGREAVVPLDRPLHMVDPSVRGMSALLQGKATLPGPAPAGSGATINVYPTQSDPEAVAMSVMNRLVTSGI
jgi:phage-related protein